MSRDVRRVPLDWKHPTEPNPYWFEQTASALSRRRSLSRLHMPQERFVGLADDYVGTLTDWERELAALEARTGSEWEFDVEYYLTGFKGHGDDEAVVHPFGAWSEDGQTTSEVEVRDEDHLHELVCRQKRDERPDPTHYMPTFDVPADELGWCLYETVSEGTPVTPVFATAEELIDHLATVGMDWDQEPIRRTAAESLVRAGGSFGSLVVTGSGQLLDGAKDADVLMGGLS